MGRLTAGAPWSRRAVPTVDAELQHEDEQHEDGEEGHKDQDLVQRLARLVLAPGPHCWRTGGVRFTSSSVPSRRSGPVE